MTEVHFYHLERQSIERALPLLLEKVLQRGWRAVIEIPGAERLAALDDALWTYSDDSFLPHGRAGEADAADEPIVLTGESVNPNAAHVRVLIDGADVPEDAAGYERVILMFDGADDAAIARARADWKAAKAAGHDCAYWQQTAAGGWERKG